jgi:predicted secreted Zn-dependent protease
VSLSVVLTTVLPKAVRLAEFSREDATEWHRFMHALVRHEAQHDSIVVDQATAFLRDVDRAADRARAPRSIVQCVTTLLERIEHASKTFDALTQHGRNEGAALVVRRSTPRGS